MAYFGGVTYCSAREHFRSVELVIVVLFRYYTYRVFYKHPDDNSEMSQEWCLRFPPTRKKKHEKKKPTPKNPSVKSNSGMRFHGGTLRNRIFNIKIIIIIIPLWQSWYRLVVESGGLNLWNLSCWIRVGSWNRVCPHGIAYLTSLYVSTPWLCVKTITNLFSHDWQWWQTLLTGFGFAQTGKLQCQWVL